MTDEFYFCFTHRSEDGNWQFSRNYEYGTPWDEVLRDFIQYLSGIYGYDISDKVKYETLEDLVHCWAQDYDETME